MVENILSRGNGHRLWLFLPSLEWLLVIVLLTLVNSGSRVPKGVIGHDGQDGRMAVEAGMISCITIDLARGSCEHVVLHQMPHNPALEITPSHGN